MASHLIIVFNKMAANIFFPAKQEINAVHLKESQTFRSIRGVIFLLVQGKAMDFDLSPSIPNSVCRFFLCQQICAVLINIHSIVPFQLLTADYCHFFSTLELPIELVYGLFEVSAALE